METNWTQDFICVKIANIDESRTWMEEQEL